MTVISFEELIGETATLTVEQGREVALNIVKAACNQVTVQGGSFMHGGVVQDGQQTRVIVYHGCEEDFKMLKLIVKLDVEAHDKHDQLLNR